MIDQLPVADAAAVTSEDASRMTRLVHRPVFVNRDSTSSAQSTTGHPFLGSLAFVSGVNF
jgi:hypothetical protein